MTVMMMAITEILAATRAARRRQRHLFSIFHFRRAARCPAAAREAGGAAIDIMHAQDDHGIAALNTSVGLTDARELD